MKTQENQKIRAAAAKAGVKLWEVAEAYGVSEGVFCRKLRRELPRPEQEKILAIIAKLKE